MPKKPENNRNSIGRFVEGSSFTLVDALMEMEENLKNEKDAT